MDIELDLDQDLYCYFALDFKLTRVMENTIFPSHIKIKCEVSYLSDDDLPDYIHELAYTKVRFWFDHIVAKSVVFGRDNDWALNAFIDADGNQLIENYLMVTPREPTDDHLAELFQAKMNALADGHLLFGGMEFQSDNTNGLTFLFIGCGEGNLPDAADWFAERSYFDQPWWVRDDASTLDVVPPEDADLSEPPSFAFSLDFLADALRPQTEEKRILRPNFRPQIIDGGQTDDPAA